MATIQDINTSIMFGDFTNDQLDSIICAIKFRRAEITKSAKRTFVVGTMVKFYSRGKNREFVGKVTKMARKFATVNTGFGIWRVPANMLEAA